MRDRMTRREASFRRLMAGDGGLGWVGLGLGIVVGGCMTMRCRAVPC
jgi:hypothetical protein